MAALESERNPAEPTSGRDGVRGCTYCGLPAATNAEEPSNVAAYCCYGCRFAHTVVQEQGEIGAIRWTVIRLGLAIFFTMNLMAFTMTMWSLDVYDVEPDPFQQSLFQVFRWLSMVFALPVLMLLGVPLLQIAVESWMRRVYSTDLLIVLAVIAAYVTSVVNVVQESGTTYFEVGASVLVMITLGRWIEAAGKQKAAESLDKLLTLLPETVTKVGPDDTETSLSSTDILVGDTLRICAGQRFPTDATIRRGVTTVDEQVFTGESQPIEKSVGDCVLAGTVNVDGDVLIETAARFKEGSFGRLLGTLQEARSARGYHQRLADRVSSWFFPLITLVACGTFALHYSTGIGVAIQSAMSVLLIACPCALGLATPLAIWTALSTAVKHQVLFRSGDAVERLASTRAVCFDKTGTLTTGTPRVFQTAFFSEHDTIGLLGLAAELANSSSHPFSQAVATYVKDGWPGLGPETSKPTDGSGPEQELPSQTQHRLNHRRVVNIRTVSGGGVEATTMTGGPIRLGSVEFSCCNQHTETTKNSDFAPDLCVTCQAKVPLGLRVQLDRLRMAADQQAASIVVLSVNQTPAVGFLIAEQIRPDAHEALEQLAEQSMVLHVLSGDRPAKGKFLRQQLQVRGLQMECSLSPDRKVARITDIRRKYGTTVMVGDGINDAPALAVSDVGIAMGCGTDVSRDSAQVCLLSNDLTQIPWAIDLARRTTSVIRQNLFWAFGYNTVGVCLAVPGILNPAIAAGLMIISSLLVISNSLRLLRDEPAEDSSEEEWPKFKQGTCQTPPNGSVEPGFPSRTPSSLILPTIQTLDVNTVEPPKAGEKVFA